MTKPLFFDTDCICAFLWVNNECILTKLYPRRIIIPKPVYQEISKVPHLKKRVDQLDSDNLASIQDILFGTAEYSTYYDLTYGLSHGKVIGNGEAASLALAKQYNGIVASNNLRDVLTYIHEFNLPHITTGDILIKAYNENLITEEEGNQIWANMLSKRRKLGTKTFTDYLQKKHIN